MSPGGPEHDPLDAAVGFRPLERSDFGLLAGWLAESLVARWWHHEWTPTALDRDFGPGVDGTEPTDYLVASAGGRPLGLIQRYMLDAYPAYLTELEPLWPVAPGTMGIDYLIGEPELRGRGLGVEMIATFVARTWAEVPAATGLLVPVHATNRASWRSLERAGFTRVARGALEPDNPQDDTDHVVYELRRPAGGGPGVA